MDITGKNVTSPADLAPSSDRRALYRYKIPPGLRTYAGDVVELGFVEINSDEEIMAAKRTGNTAIRLAYELALESLREVGLKGPPGADGKPSIARHPICTADGTSDRAWRQLHPKLRTLCVTAYNELHNPKEDDTAAFLESREVSAG